MLSWVLKARWWKQLMAHLVLLGLVVFLRVHFTTTVALPNANVTHQTKAIPNRPPRHSINRSARMHSH